MTTVTRFAPSPTGYLHIGGARTALFNWLFAKHTGGKFLLRIEDTDRERSTQPAIEAILDGLKWLGLEWDGEETYQFSRAPRHREVVDELLAKGMAYKCYCTPEELAAMREQAAAEKRGFRYDGRWRERPESDAPAGIKPAIRLKAPLIGSITIKDGVQGDVTTAAEQLDDMVLLRSDGTPTYMLAVVVDDHDMGVTHIIRGDDHLTNAARQQALYDALGWTAPHFSHIPLIHGADGAKLSKRHGALGVEAYRDLGYLPEALRNYLLRLGWGHGDEEIISTDRAIEIFTIEGIGKSPSRFDFAKLDNLNGHYIREANDNRLAKLVQPLIETALGIHFTDVQHALLVKAMAGLKARAKTLLELRDNALFYFAPRPIALNEKAESMMNEDARSMLSGITEELTTLDIWQHDELEQICKAYCEKHALKLGNLMSPIRIAITGSTMSPSMFEVMSQLGKEESLSRMRDLC